jgi:CRP-like cAMP-binding protein
MEGKIRFIGPLERAIHLRSVRGLESLTVSEIATLAQRAQERFFRKGDAIFRPDKPVTALVVMVDGRAELKMEGLPAREFGPADVLGILHVLCDSPEGIDATALSDCTTLEIDRESLFEVYEDDFSVLHSAIQEIARRTLDLRRRIPAGTFLGSAEEPKELPERLGLVERLLVMLRGVVFRRVNMDAVVELARQSSEIRFGPGMRLWSRGDRSGYVYLLVAGTVTCEVERGRSFRAGPGYPLGNLESMAGMTRWYTATTESPVLAMRAETGTFLDLLEDNFDMAADYLAAMATNLLRVLREEHTRVSAEELPVRDPARP